jgi:drug/metabolite transporter (DMT)-like permease
VNVHASRTAANRAGILAMTAAMACFVVNDSLVKYVSQSVPAAQLVFVRSAMATVLVLIAAVATGATAHFREVTRGWVATRAILDALSTLLFLFALFHLPISVATAINSTSPLIITILAAILIGERIRPLLWFITAVGLCGALLVVQPQAGGLNAFAAICFASTVVLALRDVLTRRVRADIPSIVVTLATTLAVTLLAGILSLVEGWGPLRLRDFAMLGASAVFLTAAYIMIVRSTRRGDLSVISPFRYSALLFAAIAGYLVWGDRPNALAWCGIALLVGSGVYVLRAESRARVASTAG